MGAPSKVPPTLPPFARNSVMVFAFQSSVSVMSNSCRSRPRGMRRDRAWPNRLGGAQNLPERRQGFAPGDDLAEQRVERLGLMRSGGELGEVLEVGERRQRDVGAHIGHFQLTGDQPEVFGGAGAADSAVGDDAHRLVIPLGVEEV